MAYRISFLNDSSAAYLSYKSLSRWYEKHKNEYCGNPLDYVIIDIKNRMIVSDKTVLSVLEEIIKKMGITSKKNKGKNKRRYSIERILA